MQHRISFKSVYKSITSLPPTELPDLVVLTGPNGSGKSHLLESIKEGRVASSIAPTPSNEIVLYDWNSIVPKDTGRYIPSQRRTEQSQYFSLVTTSRDKILEQIKNFAHNNNLPVNAFTSWDKVKKLTSEDNFSKLVRNENEFRPVFKQFKKTLESLAANVLGSISRNNTEISQIGTQVFSQTPEAFLFAHEKEFFENPLYLWGGVDPFQQEFAKLFTNYRELLRENYALIGMESEGVGEEKSLSKEEFVKQHGPRPWEFVNDILQTCDLDFQINSPLISDNGAFEPKLTKISKDVEMKFEDLSSGEKVFMSFALCLFNSLENRQEKNFPKLLLLDEVDAPLHPSMVRFLLKTIEKILVHKHGVRVILTTHSPTTVALANEDSLYLMNPSNPSLDKTSKAVALDVLTVGVPTMSISYSGRRQVFVESKSDAEVFEKLYELFKSDIQSERSLHFIPAGRKSSDGKSENSGREQVKTLVGQLSKCGVESVFGLIDWDNGNSENGSLRVLCHGVRDGLENLMFDPVLITMTLAHADRVYCHDQGILINDETFTGIINWSSQRWQQAVDRVEKIVLEKAELSSDKREVRYRNGMVLKISTAYLKMDDHDLEARLLDRLPKLRSLNKNKGLMYHIASRVIYEHPKLAPSEITDQLRVLLD
ncbi:MAG: AAA family ATPase [Stappiaceae bacterium]